MPSARPSKANKIPGCSVVLGVFAALLLVVLYLLLSAGVLGGLIHTIVLKATSGSSTMVHVYGGASDLFTYTRADSVVVINEKGLRITIVDADVRGSAADYLIRHHVRSVSVDSLIIVTPGPSDGPPDSSLAPIFIGTMAGMVTRADTVWVSYGRIVDAGGVLLVDSMLLDAEIIDIEKIQLDVREAQSYIPEFGMLEACGTLFVDSSSTSLQEFNVQSPPGSLQLSGNLQADSTFSFAFNGTVSSLFIPGAPYAVGNIVGQGTGSIMDPLLVFSLSEGCFSYDGLLVGVTADSISATRTDCSVRGVNVVTGGASVSMAGGLQFESMAWNGLVQGSLQSVDVSSYLPEFPVTDVSGSFNASGYGTASFFEYGSFNCDFGRSRVNGYSVNTLVLNCNVNQRELSGSLQTDFQGGRVSSEFSSSLGLDFMPVAWKADLNAVIQSGEFLAPFTNPVVAGARGVSLTVSGEGGRTAFTANALIGLNSFQMDDVAVKDASFTGFVRSEATGMHVKGSLQVDSVIVSEIAELVAAGLTAEIEATGTLEELQASGSFDLSSLVHNEVVSEGLQFSGDVGIADSEISGQGGFSVDSIFLGGNSYSCSAGIVAVPGFVRLDSLSLGAPGDLVLDLSGNFLYGPDSLAFSMDGIALTKAGKLRIVSSGDLEFVTDSTGMSLDTLWLDLPSGEIAADGWMNGDSLVASANLSGVDISSLTSMLGLSVPLSGILEADFSTSGRIDNLQTFLSASIQHPTYDQWDRSDSLTINIHSLEDSLVVDGFWTWTNGVRSGFRFGLDQIWGSNHELDLGFPDIAWLEAELTGVGDELFYLLPLPFKTSGASVSARMEYQRDTAEFSAGVASHFDRIYLTNPGMEFPGVSMYLTYPDVRDDESYNGRMTVNSSEGQSVSLESTVLFNVEENLPITEGSLPLVLKGYKFTADFAGWETIIAGVGWLQLSGSLLSQSDDMLDKPRVSGKLSIDQATISMGGGGTLDGGGGAASGGHSELPLDLSIRISGDRGIWFRNNYANVELSAIVDLTTVRGQLLIGGDIEAVRGGVYLLGREFKITQGTVKILQTSPLGVELDIEAESRIRSTVSGAEYTITVTVTGDPENPDIVLSGTGPSGTIEDQDIVTLLTAGMTYGELQQFDSSALGNVAGNYLGQWLASSIRDDVGLDALQFNPDFSSDSTSLVVNAGKYVLPDLFVSYSSDVFSSDAGTLSAQYYFNRDFFLEGSTKSTLTGNQDPSIELHYTYRY